MITIHLYLIPLIVTLLLGILSSVIEEGEMGPIGLLTGICCFLSVIFYCILGIIWLFAHVRITY
jgi:hypothetical protein